MVDTVRTLRRAFAIVECFDSSSPALTLTELSKRVGMNKSTVHRIVTALEDGGLIERNPTTQQYELGFNILHWASIRLSQVDVRTAALPHVRSLHALTGETVHLSLLSGYRRVYVEQLESPQPVRRVVEIGVPLPLYCGAAGKALLAALPEDAISKALAVEPPKALTPFTIVDVGKLRNELAKVRRRGYAVALRERILDGAGVAAAIRGVDGQPFAAIGISFPSTRFRPQNVSEWGPRVRDAAHAVSRQSGWLHDKAPAV